MRKQPRLTALLLCSFVALAPGPPVRSTGLRLGASLPEVDVRLLSGEPTPTGTAFRGKVVVVDFWASWCAPCVAAFPALNALHRQFAESGVEFLSITYEPEPFVRAFLAEHALETDVALDDSLDAFRRFHAWGIPVVYVFDRQSKLVAAVHPNRLTPSVLAAALRGEVPQIEQSEPWPDPAGAEEYFRKIQLELLAKYPVGDVR